MPRSQSSENLRYSLFNGIVQRQIRIVRKLDGLLLPNGPGSLLRIRRLALELAVDFLSVNVLLSNTYRYIILLVSSGKITEVGYSDGSWLTLGL
jgi:hypothetical protein